MADIALARAHRVEIVESIEQKTLAADEEITPGAPVRISGNRFVNAKGDTAANAAAYGIATGDQKVPKGMAVTAIAQGTLDGFTFAGDTGASVYVSNTAGRLADAAGTAEVVVGTIVPGTAETLGNSAKLLRVRL